MKNLIIIALATILLQSCKTYNYSYDKKSTSFNDNLITFEQPRIESNYSVVPYISVLGIGIGGGYLLGNHVYDNMIGVGSPKDTAGLSRGFIYLGGVIAAGYGVYALIKDTSAKKIKYIHYDSEKINEWFAHVVDTDDYNLVGSGESSIYALKNLDPKELTSSNMNSLLVVYKAMNYPEYRLLRDSIMIYSYDNLYKSQHYDFYKATDKRYSIYLTDCLEDIYDFNDIIEYARDVKASDNLNREELFIKSANQSYNIVINSRGLEDIRKWKEVFDNIEYREINKLKVSVNRRESELIEKQIISERLEEEDLIVNAIKIESFTKDGAYRKGLNPLDPNHPKVSDERLIKILNLPIQTDKKLDEIVIEYSVLYDNLLNHAENYSQYKKELESLTIRTERMIRLNKYKIGALNKYINIMTTAKSSELFLKQLAEQVMIYSKNDVYKFESDLSKIETAYNEELKNKEERKMLEVENQRLNEFSKYKKIKKGTCLKVAHRISEEGGVFALVDMLTDGSSNTGYWYQAKVIEVKSASIVVEIQIILGGLLDNDVNRRKNKWAKDQIVEISNPYFIKKCY